MAQWPQQLIELLSSSLSSCVGPLVGDPAVFEVRERAISFRSQQATVRGHMFTPVGWPAGSLPPVVIYSHGFSATQNMGLLDTARRLCARTGCAGLTFDHVGFGESGGERRQMCKWAQAVAYLDAVTYVLQAETAEVDVERICLWGESLSSRLAMVAAAVEPRVAAVLLVTPPCGRQLGDWANPLNAASQAFGPDGGRATVHTTEAVPPSPTTSSVGAPPAGTVDAIFDRMREQLSRMRAKSALISDSRLGPAGGAIIPATVAQDSLAVRTMPPTTMRHHAMPCDAMRRHATRQGVLTCLAVRARAFAGHPATPRAEPHLARACQR